MRRILSRRTLVASLLGVTAFGAVFGSAASLGLSSENLGAGATTLASCDTDGVTVVYEKTYRSTPSAGYYVTDVMIKGVADLCDGQVVSVTLTVSGDGQPTNGSLTIPTSLAVDHKVNVSPSVLAKDVVQTHVVIAG